MNKPYPGNIGDGFFICIRAGENCIDAVHNFNKTLLMYCKLPATFHNYMLDAISIVDPNSSSEFYIYNTGSLSCKGGFTVKFYIDYLDSFIELGLQSATSQHLFS